MRCRGAPKRREPTGPLNGARPIGHGLLGLLDSPALHFCMSDELLLTNLILDSSFSDYVVFMGTAEQPKKHGIVDAVSFERCSDRGKNQRHSCSVLPTFASPTRV